MNLTWFKFDECTGATLYDSGDGTSTDLTLTIGGLGGNDATGDCTTVDTTTAWYNGRTGKFGSAMDFDGTDDFAVYTSGQIVDTPLTQVSFSAWLNPDSVSGMQNIFEQISGAIQLNRAAAQWQVIVRNAASTSVTVTDGTATAGSWSHVTGVYDGNNVKLYVDGKFITQTDQTGLLFNASQGFILGCDGDTSNVCVAGTFYAGQVDDLRIYPYALSDDQVKREFNEGRSVRF